MSKPTSAKILYQGGKTWYHGGCTGKRGSVSVKEKMKKMNGQKSWDNLYSVSNERKEGKMS